MDPSTWVIPYLNLEEFLSDAAPPPLSPCHTACVQGFGSSADAPSPEFRSNTAAPSPTVLQCQGFGSSCDAPSPEFRSNTAAPSPTVLQCQGFGSSCDAPLPAPVLQESGRNTTVFQYQESGEGGAAASSRQKATRKPKSLIDKEWRDRRKKKLQEVNNSLAELRKRKELLQQENDRARKRNQEIHQKYDSIKDQTKRLRESKAELEHQNAKLKGCLDMLIDQAIPRKLEGEDGDPNYELKRRLLKMKYIKQALLDTMLKKF